MEMCCSYLVLVDLKSHFSICITITNSKIKTPCKLKLPIMLVFLVHVLHHSTKTTVEILQIKVILS